MTRYGLLLWSIVLFSLFAASIPSATAGDEPPVWRVFPVGTTPDDARLGKPRGLRDAYHPWKPPETREAWEREARAIRERVLVSNGLWPMPPETPLEPVIYGTVDRGDYTIDKVYFASYPGHYVTGNLYRPKDVKGRIPGVLCPHGHWQDARFYDAGESAAAKIIAQGGEQYMSGARHHLQARMVQLARMGCVVFHYDMVGYSDSRQIAHREGFTDVEASLRLQNFMGLQTYNSIRSLDFLLSLPEVDPKRIGVTGASGGGTQTFILCAIDPRPTVAFPAVMVSTAMQGGCICENAEYLRIGINNVAIAAVFAPKPLALSGANDWTIDIETKGLPELKHVYSLYDCPERVDAQCFPQFGHNYNQVSREVMFNWFNQHLQLELPSPVRQQDFWPATREELTVFDDEHPLPDDAKSARELRQELTRMADEQFAALVPKSSDDMQKYRRIVGTAAKVMLDEGVPSEDEVQTTRTSEQLLDGNIRLMKGTVSRSGSGEEIPWLLVAPEQQNGTVVLWIDEEGKSHLFNADGELQPAIRQLLDQGVTVASIDAFLTGEFLVDDGPVRPAVDERYVGYTFGYNRPLLSNRVRDILTALGGLLKQSDVKKIHLVGTGAAGVWTLLARSLAENSVERTIVDVNGFGFANVREHNDPMLLPGALKYGGLGGIAALSAPASLTVADFADVPAAEKQPLIDVYAAVNGQLTVDDDDLTPAEIVEAILR